MIGELLGEEMELDLSDKMNRQLFVMAQLMNEVNQQNNFEFRKDILGTSNNVHISELQN